jgi:hypothetical protein
VKPEKYAHVPVRHETYASLAKLKTELGVKSLEEVVQQLLKAYDDYKQLQIREKVRKVVCNDLSESRASLPGWMKILPPKLGSSDLVLAALDYLVPDPKEPGIFIVSKDRCKE